MLVPKMWQKINFGLQIFFRFVENVGILGPFWWSNILSSKLLCFRVWMLNFRALEGFTLVQVATITIFSPFFDGLMVLIHRKSVQKIGSEDRWIDSRTPSWAIGGFFQNLFLGFPPILVIHFPLPIIMYQSFWLIWEKTTTRNRFLRSKYVGADA